MKYISNQDLAFLLELVKKLTTQFYSQNPPPKRPSRPPAHTTEITTLPAILKTHKNVSCRTLELILGLAHSPDFSTTFYRFWIQRHGETYANELKLLWSVLDRFEFKAQRFVADGYYNSVRLIEHFEQRQTRRVTLISETTRQEVRNRYRKVVKERYEDERCYGRICRRSRYEVERLFGNVKRACGGRDNTKLYEFASVFVLVRFILWNLMTLLKLSFLMFFHIRYRVIIICL